MDTSINLLILAAFLGAPGLLIGIPAGRKVAQFGGSSAIALVAGAVTGLACGAVPAVALVIDVQSSTDANAAIALIFLPLPLFANLLTGTLAAFAAYERLMRRAMTT
ncbi:MAG: hypothetical protein QOE17_1327 [Gaiellales bacterium]|nr:hypothetical protein [Gaiellales bacterium]